MPDLSRKRDRERLKVRPDPYWQRLSKGAFLGFRRGADTWLARYRDRNGKQNYKPLEGAVEFDDAKRLAEEWLRSVAGLGGTAKRGTVREALEAYLTWLREQGRDATADENADRFRLCVYSDLIADVRLEDATGDDFREWRQRLRKGRQARTVNRHVRAVAAGLNLAQRELRYTGNPQAWRLRALADDVEETGETAVFLTPEQRAAVINAASSALGLFLRGLEHTGARPGELAAATVGKLDAAEGTLLLYSRKGRPARLRPRSVVLSSEGRAFFAEQAKSKTPAAWLFTDPDGEQWHRHTWAAEFRAAVAAVNDPPEGPKPKGKDRIPPEASAYAFRHARISELLQVYGVDPVTVALQTGTSLAMIERAYFKHIPSAMRAKLDAVVTKPAAKHK